MLPAARVSDMYVCPMVMIGGKPAARMGDLTAHGGSIVAGCPTVMIGG